MQPTPLRLSVQLAARAVKLMHGDEIDRFVAAILLDAARDVAGVEADAPAPLTLEAAVARLSRRGAGARLTASH